MRLQYPSDAPEKKAEYRRKWKAKKLAEDPDYFRKAAKEYCANNGEAQK